MVDGQEGVKDPLGMSAVRLEVETHIVHASATAVQNLTKCVQRADIRIDELVVRRRSRRVTRCCPRPSGSSAWPSRTSARARSTWRCTWTARRSTPSVLPLGGINVTNDVAIGLKTNLAAAEQLKIRFGTADPIAGRRTTSEVDVEGIGEGDATTASRTRAGARSSRRACARSSRRSARRSSAPATRGMLPAGLVLTGGGAQLAGTARLGREVLGMPVRIATPSGVGGLTDHLLTPAYSHVARTADAGARAAVTAYEPLRYESAPAPGMLGRMREWARGLFP